MRLKLLFLVLSFTIVTENAADSSGLNLSSVIEIVLRFILLNLKRMETVTLEDTTLTIPEEIKNISMGTIDIKEARISGFETLSTTNISANDIYTTDESTKTNVCVKFLIDQLTLSSNYDADVGILNEIPLYGIGELSLAVSKVNFDLCVNINIDETFSQVYVDELALTLGFRDSPSHITGFWKNDEVSDLVTSVINILEKFFCIVLNYEKECLSCVVNPVLQYVINKILPNERIDTLEINCSCLEELFRDGYGSEEMFKELIESYNNGNITSLLTSTNTEYFLKLLESAEEYILQILRNNGLKIDG